ncbi:CehA/McbA family metallohydrolase [Myxococcota bacterium]|nr:CehA/McbA family metallohydrolase [Myxococcota bacterium]
MRRLRSSSLAGALALASGLAFTSCSGCDDPAPAGPGLIRKITSEAELVGGLEAAGRVGDWLLTNGRARFVVQDAGSATGWGLYGGSLVDVDLAPASATSAGGDDRFQELFYQCDLRAFEPTSSEVVADGADGGPAILRLKGRDRGIPLIDAAFATQPLDVELSVDYVLPPTGNTLEIVLRARSVRPGSRDLSCGLVYMKGDGWASFFDGAGFTSSPPSELPFLAAAAPDGRTSLAVWAASGPLFLQLPQSEVQPLSVGTRLIPGGGTLEERFFVSLGSGDVESALAERRRVAATLVAAGAPAPVAGPEGVVDVRVPAGLDVSPTSVVLTFFDPLRREGSRATTSARPDTSGTARAELAAGRWDVEATLDDRIVGRASLELAAGATSAMTELVLDGLGQLDVTVERIDREGASLGPTAGKLVLLRGHGAAPGGSVALERYVRPVDHVVVEAGEYTAYVSHGPEDELHVEDVTITGGARATLAAKVRRVVDTTGWVSADLHVHGSKSADATAARTLRVLGAVGEGLEVLVSTDHDIVSDYAPFVRELGFEALLRTVTGIEVSPAYGHMNAFPLPAETPEAYWRVQWYRYAADGTFERVLEPAEIVRELRARDVEYVQLNHPRSGQGVFNYVRLDAATGDSARELPGADGFEVLNSRGGGEFDEALADFVGLVQANKRMTGTGVSDAHEAYDGVGWARTMIRSTDDDPVRADATALFRALREGRAIALSGPMVTIEARTSGGAPAGIGETLTASGGAEILIDVRIQAPSWMDVSRFRLFEDGNVLAEGTLGDADRDPSNPVVRLARTFRTTPPKDAFYFVVAEGAEGTRNEPVIHARARTMTNPVFVDVDGGGFRFER